MLSNLMRQLEAPQIHAGWQQPIKAPEHLLTKTVPPARRMFENTNHLSTSQVSGTL